MNADAALARLAARQRALFTRKQARAAGMTDRMLDRRAANGEVERCEPGVFRFTGAPETWEQRVLAACLAEEGWASHRTAAALWGFDGCRRRIVEVVTPRWSRRPNRSLRCHETRVLEEIDKDEVDGIPTTSRERTIIDLGAVLPAERIETIYHDALNRTWVSPESVWQSLERLDSPGRPWVAVTRRLVARTLGSQGVRPNRFEAMLAEALVRGGLPAPELQVEIHRPDGSFLARVDAAYVSTKVVVECDSFEWHGSWVRRKQDFRRDRELTALGYRVLRMSWEDVTHGADELVRHVADALQIASA